MTTESPIASVPPPADADASMMETRTKRETVEQETTTEDSPATEDSTTTTRPTNATDDSPPNDEESDDARPLPPPAPAPRAPAWGGSSLAFAAAKRSPAPRFADILRDQSHDRAAARLVYAESGDTRTLAEIQAEQERLFASLSKSGRIESGGGGGDEDGNGNDCEGEADEGKSASGVRGEQPPVLAAQDDEEERLMIERAMKESLAQFHTTNTSITATTTATNNNNAIANSGTVGSYGCIPNTRSADDDLDDAKRSALTAAKASAIAYAVSRDDDYDEDEDDRVMIEAVIREADARARQRIERVSDDAKPAARAVAANEDDERAMIEAAIREADEKERQQSAGSKWDDAKPAAKAPAAAAFSPTDEDDERAMIEAAIREADERERQQGSGSGSDDAKPAARAMTANEDDERAMIEAAIREADEKERQTAEAESLKLVMRLQQEELADARRRKRHQEQTRLTTGNVRTMTRAELEAETYGNLLANSHPEPQHRHPYGDEEDDENLAFETGFRMNRQHHPAGQTSEWQRKDRNTIVGPNRETRTKHDVHLQGQANASFLDLDIIDEDHGLRTHVGNTAFNAFRKTVAGSKGGHRGTSKGVATHGTGRAGTDSDATKGGALDQHVRLHISKAINAGVIERCNGVVKQGKEAVVYHAVGGATTAEASAETEFRGDGDVRASEDDAKDDEIDDAIGNNDGHDVAIKVFKRIKEFRGRGEYVDGDPRYAGRPFRSFTDREQLEVWTEKEFRNLVRAYRARVPVPNPIQYKENVLFMRFLGQDGWPAPQIREIEVRKGSSKWTALYEQVMESVRRLFRDARLVHGDLSEYNILVAPNSQLDHESSSSSSINNNDNDNDNDDNNNNKKNNGDDLQTALIDFGQAVEVRHPKAKELLQRDLSRVREFFVKKGVESTRSDEEALRFVIGDHSFSVHLKECDVHDT